MTPSLAQRNTLALPTPAAAMTCSVVAQVGSSESDDTRRSVAGAQFGACTYKNGFYLKFKKTC